RTALGRGAGVPVLGRPPCAGSLVQNDFAGQSGTRPQALLGAQYLLRAVQAQLGRSKKPFALHACKSWRRLACQAWLFTAVGGGGGGGGAISTGCSDGCWPPVPLRPRPETSAMPCRP